MDIATLQKPEKKKMKLVFETTTRTFAPRCGEIAEQHVVCRSGRGPERDPSYLGTEGPVGREGPTAAKAK